MATFRERDVHSAKCMFSLYYCICNFGCFLCWFRGGTVILIAQDAGHCLPFTISPLISLESDSLLN